MCAENSIEFVDRDIIACSSKWRHLGMQLLPRPGYEKKNALTGGVEKGAEKGISLVLTWMGELLEECFVTRGGDSGGWWFTAFFHAVYVVVECSRVPPLSPPTEPTTTIIAINQHQHHNSRRRNDCFLSHSVTLTLCLDDTLGRLWPAGRETFTREISSPQDDIDIQCNSREL